ncbi:putative quinol monooxygenase [Aestuariispira insulae]|uniref:Quinol monooxygenase YgiN n=1 Tax=Aestuariispira insulae TaxID=1461337 RepID=A0A3D9HJY6_9PROT|nr:antibiotic biosynthesis monooxygenase family protein [Aestuariispira insulae]RED49817.1 quinol monooxygenase YgiN [Aestuariispira insulae]
MPVTRITEFKAAERKAGDLHDFLLGLVPYISGSAGCHSVEVLKKGSDTSSFLVLERWDSAESHMASVSGFPREDMEAIMPLLAQPPKGDYYTA